MADIVNRINPADFELQSVQTNLANQIDSLAASAGNTKTSDQIRLKPLLQQVRGAGTTTSIKTPALLVEGDTSNSGQMTYVIGTAPTVDKPSIAAHGTIYGNVAQFGDTFQTGNSFQAGNTSTSGNVVAGGSESVGGSLTVGGTTSLNDNVSIRPKTGNGVVITPGVTGAAFYITNVAGNVANFLVNESGYLSTQSGAVFSDTVQAPSFVSGIGFKTFVPMGGINRNNAGGIMRGFDSVPGNNTGIMINTPMPFAGSVVGISIQFSSNPTVAIPIYVFKNNSTTMNPFISAPPMPAGQAIYTTSFVKGRFPFAAGDVLGVGSDGPVTGTGILGAPTYSTHTARFGLIVELGA